MSFPAHQSRTAKSVLGSRWPTIGRQIATCHHELSSHAVDPDWTKNSSLLGDLRMSTHRDGRRPHQVWEAIERRAQGLPIRLIAIQLGRSRSTITRWLQQREHF
ncbi:helix-turn-helix domain-containing protein [Amycolatopsis japonica]|uniref:helix-turn-helix domain-containing protein n=1 Tax=Amycolatopsis japonica TaxID=208439 RepID=UPI0011DD35E1